jgi:hypothetical protein
MSDYTHVTLKERAMSATMAATERKYYAVNSNPPREVCYKVYKRQQMERAICSAFVRSCLKAGYTLSVHNGEEFVISNSKSYKAVMAELFSTDEEYIYVRNHAGERIGWVFCVYGNDGYDVFSDYTTGLEALGLMTKANEVSDRLSERP